MRQFRPARMSLFSLMVIAILIVAVGCERDGNDPPAGLGSGTPDHEVEQETSVPAVNSDETSGTVVPQVTEESEAADETPGEEGLPPPNPEGTQLPLADRTVTPDSGAVGPQGEALFPDVDVVEPNFENYTLTVTGDVPATEDEETGDTAIDLMYEQSAPDTFHLLFDGADEFAVEAWQISDQMWIRNEGGTVEEATEDLAEAYSVSSYLTMLPEVNKVSEAEEIGEEEIDGRAVTHYSIPADEAIRNLPAAENGEAEEPEGSVEVWIDDEQNVIRMTVDLTWMDAGQNEQAMQLDYDVTAIDATEDVEAPAQ